MCLTPLSLYQSLELFLQLKSNTKDFMCSGKEGYILLCGLFVAHGYKLSALSSAALLALC